MNRWVLRCNPASKTVERLKIDWAPVQKYFSSSDRNASFEGIALSPTKIFVANERKWGRLITVDRSSLKVVDSFVVRPAGSRSVDVHYSDLCWFEGALLFSSGKVGLCSKWILPPIEFWLSMIFENSRPARRPPTSGILLCRNHGRAGGR